MFFETHCRTNATRSSLLKIQKVSANIGETFFSQLNYSEIRDIKVSQHNAKHFEIFKLNTAYTDVKRNVFATSITSTNNEDK